jgi:hypothetical protein
MVYGAGTVSCGKWTADKNSTMSILRNREFSVISQASTSSPWLGCETPTQLGSGHPSVKQTDPDAQFR